MDVTGDNVVGAVGTNEDESLQPQDVGAGDGGSGEGGGGSGGGEDVTGGGDVAEVDNTNHGDLVTPTKVDVVSTKLRSWVRRNAAICGFCFGLGPYLVLLQ